MQIVGHFVSQEMTLDVDVSHEMTLDVDIIQELLYDRVAEEEMPQVEPIKEVTITQEKAAEAKKAPYTGIRGQQPGEKSKKLMHR
ncbi:5350_t:CDS:2 [Racocetra fulgida]|uniref:5350_t:CDS:1 n=1 Tax=Racocetra fulgida TaxID=60492 RepID=A0A9N8ZQV0_9GLOM|nr:5350_t:CDS:2 [Racocetra fulgida]